MISASLISFPILTRLLTVTEYGILGLCNTTLFLGIAVSKLGLQGSIVRYYGEYRKRNELNSFYSTYLFGGIAISTLMTLAMVPVVLVVAPIQYKHTILAVLLVVFSMPLYSVIINFLRAEENFTTNAVLDVIMRYAGTFSGIALIYWFGMRIAGIFMAQFVVISLLTVWYILRHRKKYINPARLFSPDLFKKSISYGLPLLVFELSSVVLGFSDRYLIVHYLGSEQLGYYMAGYTICFYIGEILKQTLSNVIMPIYLNIYAEKGLNETALFIKKIIPYFFLVIAPIFAGCVAIKTDLIVLLASEKYIAASEIIPWVLAGTLLYACQPLISAGIYIKKQTRIFSIVIFAGAIVNIFLNILLIPRYGIIAAAWSTAFSYSGILVVMVVISNKFLPILFPVKRIILYSFNSLVMYFMVNIMNTSLPWKIISGMVLYVALVLLLDRKVASEIRTIIHDFPRQGASVK